MADIPGWIASYGQLGVMLWMVFEVRDLRRWFISHLTMHHADEFKKAKNG